MQNMDLCTGCRACEQFCPVNAIGMRENKEGFLYPVTDTTACINCGLCDKRCPIYYNTLHGNPESSYGFLSHDLENLKQSSSGGVFWEVSRIVLMKGGVVFGTIFDEKMQVITAMAEKESQVKSMCGSKYVQSDTKQIYREIKDILDKKIAVLYCAVPCQIAGLKAYLGKDYEQLYLIDLFCHGVPSPKLFYLYLQWLEKRLKGELKKFRFREKEYGWEAIGSVMVEDKKFKLGSFEDPYYCSFLQGKTFRKSCYSCKYAQNKRTGDISIGDFWGVQALYPELKTKKGVSAVLVNTEKGRILLEQLKENNYIFETSFDNIAKNNRSLEHPEKEPKIRDIIYKKIEKTSFEKVANRYLFTSPKLILQVKERMPIEWKQKILKVMHKY